MNLLKKIVMVRPVISLLKNRLWLFLSLMVTMAMASSSFVSCSAFDSQNSTNQASTNSNNNDDDDDDDSDDDDDDNEAEECEDDEGDLCKGNETCEEICESIYEEFEEKRLCMNRGDETVGKLEKVHDLLMGRKAGTGNEKTRSAAVVEDDLNNIGDDDDDGVSRDDFKCYVQIGVTKWITQIKAGLGPSSGDTDTVKRSRLLKTIKWLVEDDAESAEILKDDINEGDDILEALLLTLAGDLKFTHENENVPDHDDKLCLGGNSYSHENDLINSADKRTNRRIWILEANANNIKVRYHKGSSADGTIQLSSTRDKELFNALSCMHGEDMGVRNIFAYSAEEGDGNEHIFDLAFGLLQNVCNDVENADDRSAGCARTLMCWTAWQNACSDDDKGHDCAKEPDDDHNDKLWEMLSEYENDLEKDDSNYNDCSAGGFADFF